MPAYKPARPLVHFTPPQMWLNDPNGLVYHQGRYHLFYQYHPDSLVWGPMHWGHAVSRDLVEWDHRPIALHPDEHGMIFSGSAVVDWRDTAGFGPEALVAFFTQDNQGRQSQSLAYSRDGGETWIKYTGNPVLWPPAGQDDFRDPKVFWYGASDAGHWVMALALGARRALQFYTSADLIHWEFGSEFAAPAGAPADIWETPDLFHLPVDQGPESRWVLAIGVQVTFPSGGSGTRYFVGQFDGCTFTAEHPWEPALWGDYGADFYAAQSWSDEPGGRRIWIGWLNNWQYGKQIPAADWRGAFSLPRQLTLTATPEGPRLVQHPLPELLRRRGPAQSRRNLSLPAAGLTLAAPAAALEIDAEFKVEAARGCFGLGLRWASGDHTTLTYDPAHQTLTLDRTQSGQVDFGPGFRTAHTAPLPTGASVRLEVFVDHGSVEVFAAGGRVTLTDQIFPDEAGGLSVEVFAEGGAVTVATLDIYPLLA